MKLVSTRGIAGLRVGWPQRLKQKPAPSPTNARVVRVPTQAEAVLAVIVRIISGGPVSASSFLLNAYHFLTTDKIPAAPGPVCRAFWTRVTFSKRSFKKGTIERYLRQIF
jgi:hypothetical protein